MGWRGYGGKTICGAGLRNGEYAECPLGRVLDADGRDAADALLAAGRGRRYNGGRRVGWCD